MKLSHLNHIGASKPCRLASVVIATKQSSAMAGLGLDCRASLAMTVKGTRRELGCFVAALLAMTGREQ